MDINQPTQNGNGSGGAIAPGRTRRAGQTLAPVAVPGSEPVSETQTGLLPDRGGSPGLEKLPRDPKQPDAEYDFLVGPIIDREMLKMAQATAWHWGVQTHEALITLGWIREEEYIAALANLLQLAVITTQIKFLPLKAPDAEAPYPGLVRATLPDMQNTTFFVLDGLSQTPAQIQALLARHGFGAGQVVLVPPAVLRHGLESANTDQLLSSAINGLRVARPELSAGTPVWLWQLLALTGVIGLAIGGLMVAPVLAGAVLLGLLSIPFLCVVILRSLALFAPADAALSKPAELIDIPESQLPTYTILVPLFRENEILPDLVQALQKLDYPAAKLEIFLILETIDAPMQRAVAAMRLPPHFRIILVPDAQPRTKPKALNYAMQLAKGEYVVVYDAEDVPEPDQLRQVVAGFALGDERLVCIQARLNVYNPNDSWLSRQFAIEYTILFDAILPTLQRLQIPVPLGGTSNHFARAVLQRLGGWDPFNVTEDADLGIRLARYGFETAIISSTTWEEAPSSLWVWIKQRTRWLKGWMQTYLVHGRRPLVMLRELGVRKFAGFHILMGGILVSALVHPVFYILLATDLWFERFLLVPDTLLAQILWTIAGVNLVLGYLSALALGVMSVNRRKHLGLMGHVLLMPLYWLLISVAAYRALWQLFRAPYKWEKTAHKRRK